MPTVSVSRAELMAQLERDYSDEQFDELCFEFGLELDDVSEEAPSPGATPEILYKIEVPANRSDLLCIEGIAQALRVFLGLDRATPALVAVTPDPPAVPIEIVVHESSTVDAGRPFIVGAILRGLNLDQRAYDSLIDLQDKLHHNICRRRTLVAIGTHDLDAVEPPFTYEALPPGEISFVPLRPADAEYTGEQLMKVYQDDRQLKKYLHILEGRPRFPVVLDARRRVLSMPPIINGHLSRISPSTRNMFIECTATDLTKAHVVLNTVVAMFAKYCDRPYSVEPIRVLSSGGLANGGSAEDHASQCCNCKCPGVITTPDLSQSRVTASVDYVNRSIGIDLVGDKMVDLLRRMQLPATHDDGVLTLLIPPIRSDVLHACDIMNDVAIAYGFNRVPERVPGTSTVGKQQPLNHLSDLIRREAFAQSGYTEVLTWVTVSNAENFSMLRRVDDGSVAVKIGNPKTLEFQECRTTLLSGLLKTLRENRKAKVPLRLFEVGDVVVKSAEADVLAKNRRKMAAVYCSTTAGFEIIHGLLDQIMRTLGVPKGAGNHRSWRLDGETCKDDTLLPRRRANVVFDNETIGTIGWIHPHVLEAFSLSYPCSALEIDLECFL